jgi:RimJ/RimL family protein N-acetyltransferase
MSVRIRRARPEDAAFLHALGTHPDVDPFLAARRDRSLEAVAADIERSEREPERFGRFVIEVDGEPAGGVSFEVVNERSAIGELRNLAVHPAFRGRGVAAEASALLQRHLLEEVGLHRLQLEIYGFNTRAQAHAERAGFVREGVRRNAYRHGDGWTDGVLYGLVAEDLG